MAYVIHENNQTVFVPKAIHPLNESYFDESYSISSNSNKMELEAPTSIGLNVSENSNSTSNKMELENENYIFPQNSDNTFNYVF